MQQRGRHPEMNSSARANPGFSVEREVENKTVDRHGDTSCDFDRSKDVQMLLTCFDDVDINGCTRNKRRRGTVCANFIFRGFGPWCQNLENKTSVRYTSFSSQPSSVNNTSVHAATKEIKLQQAGLGRGDVCANLANKVRRSTVAGRARGPPGHTRRDARMESGFPRQPPSQRSDENDFVFRHHENISDFIKDYRSRHTVCVISSTDRKTSVTRTDVPEPYVLNCKQPCLVHSVYDYDLSSTDLDPLIGYGMPSAEKTRAVPNLAPVREKKTEREQKNSPETSEASQPVTSKTSKYQLPPRPLGHIHPGCTAAEEIKHPSLTNQLQPETSLPNHLLRGTSLTILLTPVTRSSMSDTKFALASNASFPSLDKIALTQQNSSKIDRRNRREMEVGFKYSNRRQDTTGAQKRGSLPDVPQNALITKNRRGIRQETRKYDGGRAGRTQGNKNCAVAESDSSNSQNIGYREAYLVKSQSDHLTPSCPSGDCSTLPEILKSSHATDGEPDSQRQTVLTLARVLLGADARLALSVDTTRVAPAAPRDWKSVLKRSAWATCDRIRLTGDGKSEHRLPSLVTKVHEWLRLRDCLGLEEPRPPSMFSSTAAPPSGEDSELTLKCRGVRKEGRRGRNGVMRAQSEVPKECAVGEETRDRQTAEGEANSRCPVTSENSGRHARGLPVPSLTGTAHGGSADVGEKSWIVDGRTELRMEHLGVRGRTVTCACLSSRPEDTRRPKTDTSDAPVAVNGSRRATVVRPPKRRVQRDLWVSDVTEGPVGVGRDRGTCGCRT